ncbi:NADH dehydrogenase [Herbaspirillum sp. Sphag1AN]|uniref:complex I NDUFA9 subunit family protein n=1 Tax=unclassified Herbaspirillum TaxID=2624150 RepID=UPI0016133A2F|nr:MULTISPECIES: complex I NDUFA9 subunit family protein [unclassified Herbaspirillum]MBB3212526.1 NADH dehydrogenase [Herbaspirillum sp. Sphag1AN]MBB3245723.1 NADH dehydrogenase [Herbaspirillum sp. Sphag64]
MAYKNILVIGGTGFIGSQVIARLARGAAPRITVPTRRYESSKHLLVMPTVRTVVADIHDEAALERLMDGVDTVINLVGILQSRRGPAGTAYGPDFARVHVDLPRKIVAACERRGIKRLVHVSAIGADIQAPSMYLRSKAAGEAAVLSSPEIVTTVLRPSVVFGEQDHFLNMFAALQKLFPVVPLGGAEARFQPVYVGDVAEAVVAVVQHQIGAGKIFELAGPQIYTLRQLVHLAGIYAGHPRPIIGLPSTLASLQAFCLEHLPGQLMSRDNLASMRVDNIASAPMAVELGIVPTALEQVGPRYLAGVNVQQQLDAWRRNARR